MFLQVSVCPQGGGVPGQVHPPAGTTPTWAGTHPQAGTPPRGRYTPWAGTPPSHSACCDTVNKRTVRIPLECILVFTISFLVFTLFSLKFTMPHEVHCRHCSLTRRTLCLLPS